MLDSKIRVAKENKDTRTDPTKDMALDSSVRLLKIYKVKENPALQDPNDTVSVEHGLTYPPVGINYVNVNDDPLTVGYNRGIMSFDTTKAYAIPGTYYDFSKTPAVTANKGVYFVLMIDPLEEPSIKPSPSQFNEPQIIIGEDKVEPDYTKKIHSHYDSLKVFHSGTLTIEAPIEDYGDDESHWFTTSYTHNLNYIPMFSPFTSYSEELGTFYSWEGQWYGVYAWAIGKQYGPGHKLFHNSVNYLCTHFNTSSSLNEPGVGVNWQNYWETYTPDTVPAWQSGVSYSEGDTVINGEYNTMYYCISTHTSSSSNEPDTGANWADYWWYWADDGIPENVYLNDMEQTRFRFGGVELFQIEEVFFYVTTTEIVMKYLRKGYDAGYEFWSKFPKRTITCDYTIFVNRLDEDMDLTPTSS